MKCGQTDEWTDTHDFPKSCPFYALHKEEGTHEQGSEKIFCDRL
jgi:hypothetical protein